MTQHLDGKIVDLLNKTDEERIEYILQPKWIGYKRAVKLLMQMEDLMLHPQTHRMPNLIIKAQTNNGKTFILRHFESLHPTAVDLLTGKMMMPFLMIEIISDPSVDSIYHSILRKIKIPFKDSYSRERKADMVLEGMKSFGVKVLGIDEFHVTMNTTKLRRLQLLDTVKFISNQSRIPIIAAGTYEAHTAIVSDSQLANRFKPFELSQWKPDQDFQRLLASFEKQLPLRLPSELSKPIMANLIYGLSEGWIGEVYEIISSAAKVAIQSGEERITTKIIESLGWVAPEGRKAVY